MSLTHSEVCAFALVMDGPILPSLAERGGLETQTADLESRNFLELP